MNLKNLIKIANRLDSLGLTGEADALDRFISKMAGIGSTVEENLGLAEGVISNLTLFADRYLTSVTGKSYLKRGDSPLANQIRAICSRSGINMTEEQIRITLSQMFDAATFNGAYSKLTSNEKMAFESIIVDPLVDDVKRRQGAVAAKATSGKTPMTMVESTTYPSTSKPVVPAPSKPGSKKTSPAKKETTPVKKDWNYYNSVVKDPVGQNMEKLWSRAAPLLGMGADYGSFKSWYKMVGKDMDPSACALNMFNTAIGLSDDPVVTNVSSTRAVTEPLTRNALYAYLGMNLDTRMPSSGAERFAAKQRLEAIGKGMQQEIEAEKIGKFNFDDEEEFKFDYEE